MRAGEATRPQYDRQRHDPVEHAVVVSADRVIVEGNWLLRDDARRMARVSGFCDFSLFIRAPAETLRPVDWT